jgi:ADP-ribose pyrophosphatase YjhB (NUDIX family)
VWRRIAAMPTSQSSGPIPHDQLPTAGSDIVGKLNILLESIFAQTCTGLAFSRNAYDQSRYGAILADLRKIATLLGGCDHPLATLAYIHDTRVPHGDREYVTPKVAVATISFNDSGEVLLVKRSENLWALPGGYADVGLDVVQNAEKEALEETGMEVAVKSLVGIYDSNKGDFPAIGRQVYTLVFYAELIGGKLAPDPSEVMAAAFFGLGALPRTPLVTLSQIEQGFLLFQGHVLPAVIDR